jgi:hypothetical protein
MYMPIMAGNTANNDSISSDFEKLSFKPSPRARAMVETVRESAEALYHSRLVSGLIGSRFEVEVFLALPRNSLLIFDSL